MKRITQWILILGTAVVLMLSACSLEGTSLDGSSWALSSYRDSTGDTVNILPRSTVTAHFQADTVTGIASCNNYNASYQANGNKISFGPVGTTRKVCNTPQGIMQQENAFLSALDSTASYKLRSNSLEMIDGRGNTLLVFKKVTE
jgi:heat shock protein HslJ